MPVDKNKIRRYQLYDQYLSNFYVRYSREKILWELNETLRDEGFEEVSASTVNHDISENGNFVRDMCPAVDVVSYKDPTGTTYYRYAERGYSIWKVDLESTELMHLQNALLMLRKFKGLPEMDWVDDLLESLSKRYKLSLPETDAIVELEQNLDLVGMSEHFAPVMNAILNQQVLRVRYNKSYKETIEDKFHPYYLKEYNCRWFAFGWSENDQRVNNLAIDRIVRIESTSLAYRKNEEVDFESYFDDVVGVSSVPDTPKERIRLRLTPQRYNYVKTKPIHWSQHNYDDLHEVTIDVRPNRELSAKLLSLGKDVVIVEASDDFRAIMRNIVSEMYDNYGYVQKDCTNE